MVIKGALDKLAEYGYPTVLCEVVNQFSEFSLTHFSEQMPGVLLIGSTARGELSWAKKDGTVQLFSDIEFLIAVSNKDRVKEVEFQKKIRELESKYNLGELFHIDYTVISWGKLAQLDKKFFIFESKQCGIDFSEHSICTELPTVTLSNLNWKELNEVVLHRLNSVLHMVPYSFLKSEMMEEEKLGFSLSLAKNTLDLTTWLHPYEGRMLTAGFTARLATWDESFLEKKNLGRYISADNVAYLKSCLALRKSPLEENIDPKIMFDQTLSLYKKAISYCKFMNSIEEISCVSDVLPSMKLFDEYRFRQRVSQLISMLRNFDKVGMTRFVRNSLAVRKGVAVSFCYYMLTSLNDYINGNGKCWANLNKAREELSRLVSDVGVQNKNFIEAWIDMRVHFKQYQDITRNY